MKIIPNNIYHNLHFTAGRGYYHTIWDSKISEYRIYGNMEKDKPKSYCGHATREQIRDRLNEGWYTKIDDKSPLVVRENFG